jgi:hypothetical protein
MLPMLNQGLALICLLNIALTLPSEARLAALKAQSAPAASPAQDDQGQSKNNDNDDQANEGQKRAWNIAIITTDTTIGAS